MDAIKNKKTSKRTILFRLLGGFSVLVAIIYIIYYLLIGMRYVSTDNAYVGAEVAQVTASINGTVQEVRFTDTQVVKKGEVLVVLDPIDTQLALDKKEAELMSAKATLERTQLQFNRAVKLSKSGFRSVEELNNAENDFKSAKAAVAGAEVSLKQAKVDYNRRQIVAPVDGAITNRKVQIGQYVQPGSLLLSVVPLDTLHVDANFKEGELKKVQIGQPVILKADMHGNQVIYHGKVSGFSGGTGSAFALIPAQNATGNWIKVVQRLPVRIDFTSAEELKSYPLRVGLSMDVTIDVSQKN